MILSCPSLQTRHRAWVIDPMGLGLCQMICLVGLLATINRLIRKLICEISGYLFALDSLLARFC
ncbi:hypothetical protein BDR03DRAFT_961303 [Suillus americanus]|nr:hypothetical protein BDR03DRAFT_961303 [Suillus americanus]